MQQLIAQAAWTDPDLEFWHYRDKDQVEVDLVMTRGARTWGLEIKASSSFSARDGRGLALRIGLRRWGPLPYGRGRSASRRSEDAGGAGQRDLDELNVRLASISHTHGPQRTPRHRNLLTGMPVTRDARGLIAVTGCGWGHRPPTGCRESSRGRTPTARMSPRARRADGAIAGTVWNAGLRPAQRPAGPRWRRPQSPDGSRLGTYPPTDEMAYSRRRRGFLPVGLD